MLACIAGLNWLVNPFSLFDPPTISRLNVNKPGYIEHLRLTHTHRVAAQRPDCILLGTSRTGRGLRPDHPSIAQLDCYNLSLPAISMYEMRRYIQHAVALQPLKLAILSIDFRVMSTAADRSGAFVEARLAASEDGTHQFAPFSAWLPDMVAALLSVSAIEASVDSVRRQSWVKDSLRKDGLWVQLDDQYDHRTGFNAYTRNTLRRFAEAREQEDIFRENLGHVRRMLREAYSRNIDLRMLIPPSHAWHWQALWQSGLWPRFEEMKRALVEINDEEAQRAKRAAYPIWDFSGSRGPALENPPTERSQKMQWFWEPVHFKTALGDVVLDRVMGVSAMDGATASFGTRLRPDDLSAHLQRLRKLQADFGAEHPEVVQHIRALAEQNTEEPR